MTDLDDELLPAVTELIAAIGVSATYRLSGSVAYNPADGTVVLDTDDATEPDYTVTVSPPAPASASIVERGLAEQDSTVVYLAGEDLAFTPTVGDRVTINSRHYRVTAVDRYESGASVCAWGLVVQGGAE